MHGWFMADSLVDTRRQRGTKMTNSRQPRLDERYRMAVEERQKNGRTTGEPDVVSDDGR